jgi:catechol 2,3-dioxygenase-like lactoylglutathione lyase family enzyme
MIQHVTRTVRPDALDPCVAFYELLGFTRVEPPPSLARRAAWLQPKSLQLPVSVQLHLLLDEAAEPATGHVAIWPQDYEQTLEALHRAGHAFEPRTEHWGARRGYVTDPAGNLVELMERPPTPIQ